MTIVCVDPSSLLTPYSVSSIPRPRPRPQLGINQARTKGLKSFEAPSPGPPPPHRWVTRAAHSRSLTCSVVRAASSWAEEITERVEEREAAVQTDPVKQ